MNHLGTLEHHYQDPDQPFGFVFGPSDDPAPIPEAPAAGEPLLNDIELNNSNQFFERFQNDYSIWDDHKILESLGSYQHDIPSFQGISVTLSQNNLPLTSPIQNIDFSSFGSDLTARFGHTQLASPTISDHPNLHSLDHFSLLQDNSQDVSDRRHRHSAHVFKTQELFDQQQQVEPRTAPGRSSAPNVTSAAVRNSRTPQNKLANIQTGSPDGKQRSSSGSSRQRPIPLVSFGSDLDFRNQQYEAPGTSIVEAKSREALFQENLKNFESKWSGENTAPSSPGPKSKRSLSSVNGDGKKIRGRNGSAVRSEESLAEADRAKRPKTKHQDDDDGTDESASASGPRSATPAKITKKARSKQKSMSLSERDMLPPRRKSQLSESKSQRQNLTEDEKKQNHIRSEQKRRNQIREGFASLTTMMTGPASAHQSKCLILCNAVDWLSGVIEGNEKLRAQLVRLDK